MKRALIALLSAAMVLSSVQLTVFAEETKEPVQVMPDSQENIGKLDVVVRIDYQETAETLAGRKLSLTLTDDQKQISHSLPLNDGEQTFSFNGKTITADIALHNPQDAPLGGNDKVGFYLVEFTGVPFGAAYRLKLEGNGYQSAQSFGISNSEYAPKIYFSAESGGFALGDTTGDKSIDQKDLDLVAKFLGEADGKADVNLDGVIDITDIALVHHNMVEPREAEILYGPMVAPASAIDSETTKEALEQGGTIIVDNNLEDLFVDNGNAVKLEQTDPNKNVCELPIVFKTAKQMSEINIISPAGADGALEKGRTLVEYVDADGEAKTLEIPFDNTVPEGIHAIERSAGDSTVVIKLGNRVAVKKITITVEKVIGEDGKATYAIIDRIEFLKDIIPENIDLGASIPKNVYAEPGDKTATLGWKKVDNVDGYIVRYGESETSMTLQQKVGSNEAVIVGLENLKPYYFTVTAYNGSWTGKPSAAVTCIPQPSKVPLRPDNLSLHPEDSAITVSWKKTEDAEFYNVYYKESSESAFGLAAEKTPGTSFTVTGLTNDVSYDFYVTAGNQIGFGPKSLTATGAPEKEVLKFPELPTLNRIPNSDIIKVTMNEPGNVSAEYNGKFDIKWVYDEDFETHWTAQRWGRSSRFTFEFNEEKSMDYLIYVPRLNKGYPESIGKYSVTVWDKDGNMTHLTSDQGKLDGDNAGDVAAPWVRNDPAKTGYAILPFERNDHIKKICVMVRQINGSPKPTPSLSEIAFYTYDDIDDSIAALFTDNTYTVISPSATQARIDELRARLESSDGYYVNKDILTDELDLAQALLNGDSSKLGAIMDNVQSRNASGDKKKINTFQPLGVAAEANKQIVIYAQIPEGETVTLVPTQHFAEAAKWPGSSVQLVNGRNIITIPSINNISPQKGGSLYLQYSGSKASEIKMQIRGVGATKIPMLELSDWHELSESEIKARITDYTAELNSYYTAKLSGMNSNTIQTHFLNATEIALPHVLLSLPASQVRAALGSDGVQTLYNNGLAWEELMQIMYRTHGIDEADLEASQSRHNIRYMRMFGKAFMYASGNHIGIGYGSCSGVVAGRPTSVTGNSSGLFGWGIHHEIGHVMDTLGKAEITNNIYALFGQTYDNGQNALTSRLEASNKYEKIFDKVTSGQKGMSNDVFVSLGMYWQLHLAYDGAKDNFYNEVNKALKNYSGTTDERFMAAASAVSGYDLTEFFESWGLSPTGQGGAAEERKLQYLTDESRRERLKETQKQSGTVGITASYNRDTREATVNITPVSGAKMTGYEISRELNGKTEPVAFLSTKSNVTTWKDTLGSVNNKAVRYSVKAIDILGYVIDEAVSTQVDISHDNLIKKESYTWDSSDLSNGVLTAAFSGDLSVAGVKFSDFPADAQAAEIPEKQETPSEKKEETEGPTGGSEEDAGLSGNENTNTEADDPNEPNTEEGVGDGTEGNTTEEPSTSSESQTNEEEGISAQSDEEHPVDPGTSGDIQDDAQGMSDSSSDAADSSSSAEPSDSSDAPSSSSDTADSSSSMEPSSSSNAADSSSSTEPSSSSDASSSSSSTEPSSSSDASNSSSSSFSSAASSSSGAESTSSSSAPNTPGEAGETDNAGMAKTAKAGTVTVEASVDGTTFTTVLELTYEEIQAKADKLHFFTRKDHDGSICPFDAKLIRISGLPAGFQAESIDFAEYPGDYIAFGENGIGLMAKDYNCGGDVIKAGTLVVTGSFRGNPVFNTVRVYGKSQSGDMAGDGELAETDKAVIEGEVYLFAALPESGDMAEIDNGLWIFVPKQQGDTMSEEDQGCVNSVLPTEIMAELYRTDDPESSASKRATSYTRWIPSPTYETMPAIILED